MGKQYVEDRLLILERMKPMEGNILRLKERYEYIYSDEGINSKQLDKTQYG